MPINNADQAPTDARADTSPQAFYGAGDTHDDDGQAIEQPFDPADHTGDASKWEEVAPTVQTLPVATRVLTRSIDLSNYPVGQTVMLWPADPLRKHLHIEANVAPMDINVTAATTGGTALWQGTVSSRSSAATVVLQVNTVDTAGLIQLQGSDDNQNWFTLAQASLTALNRQNAVISGPLPPYLRVWISGGTGGGTGVGNVTAALSYDDGLEGFYFSDNTNVINAPVFNVPVDSVMHNGPVYVAKAFDNQTVINSYVVTV